MPITVVDHRVLAPPCRPDGTPYGAPRAVLERFVKQVPEGTPLLFDTSGHFDQLLYRFVRELPEGGESDRRPQYSEHSWLATARDIEQWLEFLREQRNGISWLDASLADTRAYKRYRLSSGPLRNRLSAKSWNRHLNSVDKLYRWAVEEKIVDRAPFRYRTLMVRTEIGAKPRSTDVG